MMKDNDFKLFRGFEDRRTDRHWWLWSRFLYTISAINIFGLNIFPINIRPVSWRSNRMWAGRMSWTLHNCRVHAHVLEHTHRHCHSHQDLLRRENVPSSRMMSPCDHNIRWFQDNIGVQISCWCPAIYWRCRTWGHSGQDPGGTWWPRGTQLGTFIPGGHSRGHDIVNSPLVVDSDL